MTIRQKRAYEPEAPEDGFRVYVDRLWPRGLSHQTFHYDLWAKDIAPSNDLRHWYHEDQQSRWLEFAARYTRELEDNPAIKDFMKEIAGKKTVTLLYSSVDPKNNATVLASFLEKNAPDKMK